MPEFSTSIDIDAPPEIVFEHLVTPEGMTAWMCQWADLDARPGGAFSAQINGTPVQGSFVEVDPPRRVVFTWGIPGNDELPPGSTTVAFTLTGQGEGTRLDLLHSDLPDPWVANHREGWEHYLPRLRRRAAGEDVGPAIWPDPVSDSAVDGEAG